MGLQQTIRLAVALVLSLWGFTARTLTESYSQTSRLAVAGPSRWRFRTTRWSDPCEEFFWPETAKRCP